MLPLFAPITDNRFEKGSNSRAEILENELSVRIKKGDTSAMATIYEHYSASIYGIIRRIIQDDQSAEKVLQRTFENLYSSLTEEDSERRIFTRAAWIARKEAFIELKSIARESKEVCESPSQGKVVLKVIHTGKTTHRTGQASSPADIVDPKYRMILNLIYFQGFSLNEVADQLAIPADTIKLRLAKAMRQLRAGNTPN